MRFEPSDVAGVFIIKPEPHVDERGLFARTWDSSEAKSHGLDSRIAQCSTSFNTEAGTLRGLHYQEHPWEETKLVRCTAGAIFDVAVDLRRHSQTHLRWVGVELTAQNRLGLFVPAGCAHGFLSLTPGSEVYYQMSAPYRPEASRGARWDDPAFGIAWPKDPVVMNDRDRAWPLWQKEGNPDVDIHRS